MGKILESLAALGEDEFTKEILKPLFEAMGYERVEFNGGPYEKGKDLIAQRRIPPMKEMFVVYIQSKKIGTSQRTFDGAKFTSLVHQLRQCCTTTVKDNEGNDLKPNLVYLACPEQIKTRFLDEVMSQMIGLPIEVRPYDGVQIINDIRDYKPELLEKLLPMGEKLTQYSTSLDNNEELLQALKSENKVIFNDYYSDLSFFVGYFDSNLLLHLNVVLVKDKINIFEDSWEVTRKEILLLKESYNISVLTQDVSEIESVFEKWKEDYESIENKSIIQEVDSIEKEILDLNNRLQSKIKEQKEQLNFSGKIERLSLEENEYKRRSKIISEIEYFYDSNKCVDLKFEISKKEESIVFYKELDVFVDLLSKRNSLGEKLNFLKDKKVPAPLYNLEIDFKMIEDRVKSIREKYLNGVVDINDRVMSFLDLKDFLSEIESSLSFLSHIRSSESFLKEAIDFKVSASGKDRVSISPHDVFETKHDIAIYGGAGVGKTTTLKMYASRYAKKDKPEVIYVPLNSLVSKYSNFLKSNESVNILESNLIASLVLMSKSLIVNKENIREVNNIFSLGGTLILDGLDEVYNTIPNILLEISSLKSKKPNLQLIVSSRDCVSYLKDISFLGITLLPFTKPQLIRFINGWFGDGAQANKLISAIEKKDIFENIRTPLLATITCSLVEKGIDAPSTENEIYSQRLRLLTGDYDVHKKINRQKNTSDMLRRCAKKIAFSMHRKGVRSMQKNEIIKYIKSDFGESFNEKLLESCVVDLIDPCNVIVYDSHSDSYTFGHFRYQEHLASEEISSNREVDILELLFDDWWRGTLCLYAQENDFCSLIENCYNRYGSIKRARITLDAMIKNTTKSKRPRHLEIFNNYSSLSDFEAGLYKDSYLDGWDDPNDLIR
ncbi:MAG TPA: hypothetical protein DD644_14300 [Halomonas sp.]|uniref:NACHT domain-containing protein n=1 Tax=Halomonadaceae TaxID=28256 RepID=UPI000E942CC6|nr:hypothetical protein [Halomonas sp. 3A7M]HBP42881.1 hypothetical protein [Halomonas sp.]